MKKILFVLILLLVGYIYRVPLLEMLSEKITSDMFISEDTDSFDPGLPVGAIFPALKASYQGRMVTDVGEFSRDNGLVFIASRSVDWCLFCRRQAVQLQEHLAGFAESGIGVVAMTYDAPELQAPFIEQHGISYPLLSDVYAFSVRALDILNAEYTPDENEYGIPYPGIFIVRPDRSIAAKLFLEPYSIRIGAGDVLRHARIALGLTK